MAPLLWLAVAITAASAYCPTEEWLLDIDSGNCYWKSPFTVDWHSGEQTCYFEYPGSHMVSIHDNLENFFVFERVANHTWLGLRTDTGSGWYWTDHTPANFTKWCDGYPTGESDRVAWLPTERDGCWREGPGTKYIPLVCKVPGAS